MAETLVGSPDPDPRRGILVSYVSNGAISNNVIVATSITENVITLTNCKNMTVTGNVILRSVEEG